MQPVRGDVTIVLITAAPGCPSKTLHTVTSGSPVCTDGPSFVSPHHFCSPGQAQAGKPTQRPRAALPAFQRLASIESLPHQPAQASTPGAPQAGEVCLPAGRTGDQRPGSPRAACHHGATRGRPFHGARPTCWEQERTGLAPALGGHPVSFTPRGTGTLLGAWALQGTLQFRCLRGRLKP